MWNISTWSQNTSLATTSNKGLGQEKDQIAPVCVEEVHWGEHFRVSFVLEGAPLLMGHLHQVQDTPLVRWQALAEMSLSGIGKSTNPPKHRLRIHCNIVQTCCWEPPYLPTLTKNMEAAIDELSMLPKNHMKCISPQGPSVLVARSHVHSRSTCGEFSFGIRTNGFPLASFDSDYLLIVQGFAIWIIQCTASCWASSSSVRMACIKLFTAECNAFAPCSSITVSSFESSGAPEISHIVW